MTGTSFEHPADQRDNLRFDVDIIKSFDAQLRAPQLDAVWQSQHISAKQGESPYIQTAGEFLELRDTLDNHPDIINFMAVLVELEKKSLAKGDDLLPVFDRLEQELESRGADTSIKAIEAMPKHYQESLKSLKLAIGQNETRPIRSLLKGMKHGAIHVYEDMKEHPFLFSGLLGITLGTLGLMSKRGCLAPTNYVSPVETTMTNLSADKLMEMMNDPDNTDLTVDFDPSRLDMAMEPTCHDHLVCLVGQAPADFIKNVLGAADLFPQHCSQLKTLAYNAQGGRDLLASRLEPIIEYFSGQASSTMSESPFKTSFDMASQNVAEFWYSFDFTEFFTIHPIIMASSAILALDVGLMEDEERREMRHNIVDFAWRTAQKPLNYTLAASGSLYAYMANSGMTPDFLWYGVGGALCGEFLHKAVRKVKSSDLIHAITVDTKDCLEPLINSDLIASNRHIGHDEQEDNKWHIDNIYKSKGVVGTVLATTMTAIDFAATGGANAGLVAGAAAVTIPFWGYNIPQDTVAHIGFGFFGAMMGTVLLPFAILKNKLLGQGKGDNNTNPEPD